MPNWVDNQLRISGHPADIQRFLAQPFDFNTAIPYPDEYRDDTKIRAHVQEVTGKAFGLLAAAGMDRHWCPQCPKDGYNSGGYEWCIDNWGTKWNVDEAHIHTYKKSAVVLFMTAWSPPTPVILIWSRQWPQLRFKLRYYEGGAGFQGVYEAQNGTIIADASKPYRGTKGG